MLRYIRSALLKLRIRCGQKQYDRLKYLHFKGKSKTLIVSFSGFGGEGPARYNYVNTLQETDAHRLFILDDFGYKKQGSYYLGENGDWFLPEMVCDLIRKIKTENRIDHLVMIGSSKGGTAALFYGVELEAEACIIGAPQYFIGDYLNTEDHRPILQGIMGDTSAASIRKLNAVVQDRICRAEDRRLKVYIHYSPLEHTYPEHIADMVRDLKQNGFAVEEDRAYSYTEHRDVAKHFPLYLINTLDKILGRSEDL